MPKSGSKAARSGTYECKSCRERKIVKAGHQIPPCSCGGGDWYLAEATSKAKGKKKGGFLSSLFG